MSYYVGGGEVAPAYQMMELSRMGHDITLITTKARRESEYLGQLRRSGVKIIFIDDPYFRDKSNAYSDHPLNFWNQESVTMQLLSIDKIKQISPDVIVSHYTGDHIVLDEPNIVLHLHGYPEKRIEAAGIGLKRASGILSVSSEVRDKWRELFPEYKNKIKKVIRNGIATDIFKPYDERKVYDIIFVGRLIKIKGLDYLMDALKGSKLRVAIVGDGPEKDHLIKLAMKNKVKAKFFGYVKFSELPKLYSRAKIGVFPSYSREGVLTSMLEAMSCGLGIVTTDAGGMKEAIRYGGGEVVRAADSKELMRGINDILSDYVSIGKEAREIVLDRFSVQRSCIELEKFYSHFASA